VDKREHVIINVLNVAHARILGARGISEERLMNAGSGERELQALARKSFIDLTGDASEQETEHQVAKGVTCPAPQSCVHSGGETLGGEPSAPVSIGNHGVEMMVARRLFERGRTTNGTREIMHNLGLETKLCNKPGDIFIRVHLANGKLAQHSRKRANNVDEEQSHREPLVRCVRDNLPE